MNAKKAAHVLVVEDDRDIRESVIEVLEDEGYTVSGAGDGLEALQLLESGGAQPNLILLDLMMPNMNGYQFREKQLANSAIAGIPVVVITADVNAKNKADKLAVSGFVQKPLKIQQLLDLVQQWAR